MIPYRDPQYQLEAFNCPHCGAFAQQEWHDVTYHRSGRPAFATNDIETTVDISVCEHCYDYAVWHKERMLYPSGGTAPLPNSDLPEDIREDYEEARSIASLSPRGAAALLRLAIQKLRKNLGEGGKDLNGSIGKLVKRGLPVKVQQALDIVRVIGNEAVHPGQIDLKDDTATAEKLFGLVNLIAEVTITQPKHVDAFYQSLSESQKEAIDTRDSLP